MTRTQFISLINEYRVAVFRNRPIDEETAGKGILAEYDRLTALNAQLLEACIRAQMRADADPDISAYSDYYLELQAAIHAAEGAK